MIENYESLTSHGLVNTRKRCLKILDHLLSEIRGDVIVEKRIKVENNAMKIGNFSLSLNFKRIFVVGFGKASGEMALGLERILGDRITGGIINTTHTVPLKHVKVNLCSHPLPDENTVEKSREITKLLSSLQRSDLVIFAVSGGASSLFEIPADGITIEEIRNITEKMLIEGYDIERINEKRIELSSVKGGKLLKFVRSVEHLTMVISDVIGHPKYVGSGPTYGEDENYFVLADNEYARNVAKNIADKMGCPSKISGTILGGEARDMARKIYGEFMNYDGKVMIWGGETTVNVGKAKGIGGRNQELALYLAKLISGRDICFACIGTDGVDGPTNAAGAIVDGTTVKKLESSGIHVENVLENHDSNTAFNAIHDAIITGPTGTNVADICIGMKNCLKEK